MHHLRLASVISAISDGEDGFGKGRDGDVLSGKDFFDGKSAGSDGRELCWTACACIIRLTAVILLAKGIATIPLLDDRSRNWRDVRTSSRKDVLNAQCSGLDGVELVGLAVAVLTTAAAASIFLAARVTATVLGIGSGDIGLGLRRFDLRVIRVIDSSCYFSCLSSALPVTHPEDRSSIGRALLEAHARANVDRRTFARFVRETPLAGQDRRGYL